MDMRKILTYIYMYAIRMALSHWN